MEIELGVMLELPETGGLAAITPAAATATATLTGLARLAEENGLDLVVVGDGGLDPWTVAAWIAGVTKRIVVGVAVPDGAPPDPADPEAPYPAVVAKARDSLDTLAPGRMLTSPADWVVAPRAAGLAELSALGASGVPVVVPVSSADDVRRVAAFVAGRAANGGGAGGSVRPRRRAAVRARRVPGIDYDGVPESLADTAVEPGDPGYHAVSSTYMRAGAPGLVLRPRTPGEVSDALAFATRHPHLPLGLRSGGHGISGRSTNRGGLVIDVSAMNTIDVLDRDRRLVRIGPGATWKRIAAALHPYGWAIGSGDYGGVGVGGLATAGGIGFLSREQGLTIDRLRAVELVLADGSHVRASEDENPDLFWAVRGAGANFGVATAFEFEAETVGDVGWAQLVFVAPDLEGALARYGELASAAPRDTTLFLLTGQPRRGQPVVLQLFGVVDNPDPDVVVARLNPFLEIGTLAQQQTVLTPYAGVMGMAGDVGPEGQQGYGEPHSRSAFLPELTPEFARDAATMLRGGSVYFFELRAMGGAIADVPADATAFPHRTSAFSLAAFGANDKWLNAAWNPLRRHFDGLYLSFETDSGPDRLLDAFPAPVLERLRELKHRHDPHNMFHDNFTIEPATVTTEEALA
jgi:hypothetical protein